MIELSIILVSFNTSALLRTALLSLYKHMQKNWEILVVDNASLDDSVTMLKKEFPEVILIENAINVGFAAANNQAIRRARGQYVFLLNSDTYIPEDQRLSLLVQYLRDHDSAGMVTPKLVLESGELDWACHRGIPTPWNALTYFSGLERLFRTVPFVNRLTGGYHQIWNSLACVHEIDACSGAAMMVKKEAIRKVGLLDEDFFMYGEDLDWCLRFRHAGYRIMYDPRVTITHYKNKSGISHEGTHEQSHTIKKRSKASFFDTMVQFYKKHYMDTYPKWFLHCIRFGVQSIKIVKGVFHDK